jgi:hypothetical protein
MSLSSSLQNATQRFVPRDGCIVGWTIAADDTLGHQRAAATLDREPGLSRRVFESLEQLARGHVQIFRRGHLQEEGETNFEP